MASRRPAPKRRPRPAAGEDAPLLAGGAVLALGDEGEVLAQNGAVPSWLSGAGALVGRALGEVQPPVLGQTLLRLLRESRAIRCPALCELTLASALGDAEPLTVSLRVAPHPSRPGVHLVTARDMTAHGQRLQHLAETIDVLRSQRDEWEAVARAVAHDVRSSLSALLGFVKLALARPEALPEDARGHLDRALEIGARLRAHAELMVDQRRRSPAPESMELGVLGARLFTALQVAYPGVPLTWCVDVGGVTVRASASAVWNVLWGLATNAVKYRHPDRPLEVSLRARAAGGEVRLELADNGVGIPPGQEETIFQPGRRGSNVQGIEGAGLGLHSVRVLAAKCHGRVWAEPSSAGARFLVALPAAAPEEGPFPS